MPTKLFEKGQPKKGGRKKGTKNKKTIAIENTEAKAIGTGYQMYIDICCEWMASDNLETKKDGMDLFVKIFGFILPKKIQQKIEADIDNNVTITIDMAKF